MTASDTHPQSTLTFPSCNRGSFPSPSLAFITTPSLFFIHSPCFPTHHLGSRGGLQDSAGAADTTGQAPLFSCFLAVRFLTFSGPGADLWRESNMYFREWLVFELCSGEMNVQECRSARMLSSSHCERTGYRN